MTSTDATPECKWCHRRHAVVPHCEACRRPHLPDLPCWRGKYAARMRELCFREYGRRCIVCGERATTADHVLPRACTGTDELRNLQPLCQKHNSAKGARSISPYAEPRPIAGNGHPVSARSDERRAVFWVPDGP